MEKHQHMNLEEDMNASGDDVLNAVDNTNNNQDLQLNQESSHAEQ